MGTVSIPSNPEKPAPVGREAEAAKLDAWLRDVPAGAGGLCLVGGEAGVGKTYLLEYSRARSGDALKYFTGRCWQSASVGAPYRPLLEALEEFRGSPAGRERDFRLPAQLQPTSSTPPREDIPKDEILDVLLAAFQTVAEANPAVIVLEDLHWADEATLEFLAVLADRGRNMRLGILGTFRGEGLDRRHPLRACRDAVRRCLRLTEIDLPPLPAEAGAALLEQLLGGPVSSELSAALQRNSGGLPLWLGEIAQTLLRGGHLREGPRGWEVVSQAEGESAPPLIPESFRDAVLIRCEALADPAQTLLRLAAILGVEFSLDVLLEGARQLDLTDADFESALAALLKEGLLREIARSSRGEFLHALTREVILENMTWLERRRFHSLAADLLETRGTNPGTLAEHFEQAGRAEPSRRYYLEAAASSCQVHAHREALAYGLRALAQWPAGEQPEERLAAMEMIARCGKLSGQLAESAKVLREILDSPAAMTERSRKARTYSELATISLLQGAEAKSVELRSTAAAEFEAAGEDLAAAWEYLGVASHYTDRIRLSLALEATRRAAELAERQGEHELHSRALSQQGLVLAMQGEIGEGKKTVEAALALALKHNLNNAVAEAYRRLALVHDYASDYRGEAQVFQEALNFCTVNAVEGESILCLSCMAFAFMRTGEWKQSVDISREVLANKGLHEVHHALAKGVSALIQVFRGEVRGARKALEEGDAILKRAGQVPPEFFSAMGLGMFSELEGNEEEAAAQYLRLPQIWKETEDRHDVICGLCAAARFFGDRGDAETLSVFADLASRINASITNTEAFAGLAAVLGEIAMVNRAFDQAILHFKQVVTNYGQLKLPFDLAHGLYRLSLAQIASGDKPAAVENLRKALRMARNLGARPLAGRVTATLSQIGEAVEESRDAESPERAVWAGLTQRQREVAEQIAHGLTNKEIAQKLFLSPRTIDMHVGHILGRLDCRTRSEAIRKLADLGVLSEQA